MKIFHNPNEFAEVTRIWYQGKHYDVPLILDHEAAEERKRKSGDHGEGLNQLEALAYIAFSDLGFVPHRGCNIDIENTDESRMYRINKSTCEDGEIILELGAFEE